MANVKSFIVWKENGLVDEEASIASFKDYLLNIVLEQESMLTTLDSSQIGAFNETIRPFFVEGKVSSEMFHASLLLFLNKTAKKYDKSAVYTQLVSDYTETSYVTPYQSVRGKGGGIYLRGCVSVKAKK